MKKLLTAVCLLITWIASQAATPTNPEKPEFNPHWCIQLQGGVGHTLGEANFGKLLSPAAALNAARQFTPVWGLRLGLSGWESKGAWFTPSQVYKFNFLQINADVTVDLANWIGGFKYDRTVNPYVFLGVGANFAFNNGQAEGINASGKTLGLLWTGNKAFVAGRAGAGVNFRLCDRLLLGLEVNTNILSDKFNSKKAGNADWQMNALVGLTFRLGKNHKKIQAAAPPAVYTPALEPVAETSEPVVETPAPVVKTPAPVVEQPAPVVEQPTHVTDAPAPPSPESYKMRQNVFFAINSPTLRMTEDDKLNELAKYLKAHPKDQVSVVGYADAPTGSPKGNYWLSGWRALRVRDALQEKGVKPSQIRMNFVGDKEQPYSDVEDNRVVICIIW